MTTAKEVMKMIKDNDVKYVDFRFTDPRGKWQHVTFDVTMIETGQYHRAWPDWHIGPEQAIRAHQRVRGDVMLPVHWALLGLSMHGWTEPVERSSLAARQEQVILATPRPGQPFEPTLQRPNTRWWPQLPFETAAQHPIVSSNAD